MMKQDSDSEYESSSHKDYGFLQYDFSHPTSDDECSSDSDDKHMNQFHHSFTTTHNERPWIEVTNKKKKRRKKTQKAAARFQHVLSRMSESDEDSHSC